ncbi:MAG: rod shape-determining protein MreD [Butyribacter sp.]|nr:rod shape-determining protein MreD [bacterium]MDY3853503.1 rod shape-determining protein MreD [Butyribacter sp.]
MKRYISMFFIIIVGFLMQTSIFPNFQLINIMPNILVILTAASGFMFGRKVGIFSGFLCGALMDLMYGSVVGVGIFIYVLIGYVNGIANKLYFKDDLSIPLFAIAISDFGYGIMYYICYFLLRGRTDIFSYLIDIIIPEMIYTTLLGVLVYKFIHWLDDKMYPEEEVPLKKGDRIY